MMNCCVKVYTYIILDVHDYDYYFLIVMHDYY